MSELMISDRIIRIGGASGAWGDSPGALPQLLGAGVDYLMMDYLAEVSMSLLARTRLKQAESGYPPDAVAYLGENLAGLTARKVRVVTNAGGVNPQGCKRALEAAIAAAGLSLRVACIEGDDVRPLADSLRASGIREAISGETLPQRLLTANAYLGALPIRAALSAGADIVVTGRCADSALALGILMHEFGWDVRDYDRLACGSLVGHILECGPQSTGGNFTDWWSVPDWQNIGYPIAECRDDGSFILAKAKGTGGLITPPVVAEQTLYEIGDPAAYVLPDVVADFSGVTITQTAPDQVRVAGARGRAPTGQYKVSATYPSGWRAVASVSIVGPDAALKAEHTGLGLIARARRIFAERGLEDFSATHMEALGAEASYGQESRARAAREVLLRLAVAHQSRAAIDLFAREIGSVGLSCAPGTTGIYNGRPKPAPIVRLCTFFIAKSALPSPSVTIADQPAFGVEIPCESEAAPQGEAAKQGAVAAPDIVRAPAAAEEGGALISLGRLAYARSGDKGDCATIAIIARHPDLLPFLRREVTPERVIGQLCGLAEGPAHRYEAPGLHALNFLVERALGGGGMASLRIDPQGKAYGQMVLEMMLRAPPEIAALACPAHGTAPVWRGGENVKNR